MDKQPPTPAPEEHEAPARRVDPLAMMTVTLGVILLAFAAIVAI